MNKFDLLAAITAHLQGTDQAIWQKKLEDLLAGEPQKFSWPPVNVLEVLRFQGIPPDHILTHIWEQAKSTVDPKIVAVFENEKKLAVFALRRAGIQQEQVLVQFEPTLFGVEYRQHVPTEFGYEATIDYQKVVDAALKLGLRQPDFLTALYFRNQFWDAHKRSEGTRYCVGCRPLHYEEGKPPIIPVLEYDRYKGWFLLAQAIESDKPLEVSVASGQGEFCHTTFVFALPLSM